jgi:hypothetical protein
LGNLSQVEQLLISRNQLSGSIPESFGNLPLIESLWLDENYLSGNVTPAMIPSSFQGNQPELLLSQNCFEDLDENTINYIDDLDLFGFLFTPQNHPKPCYLFETNNGPGNVLVANNGSGGATLTQGSAGDNDDGGDVINMVIYNRTEVKDLEAYMKHVRNPDDSLTHRRDGNPTQPENMYKNHLTPQEIEQLIKNQEEREQRQIEAKKEKIKQRLR